MIPVTLLSTDEIFSPDLEGLLQLFAAYDDVFIPEFGNVLIEKPPGIGEGNGTRNSSNSASTPKLTHGTHLYHLDGPMIALDALTELPSGPYFLSGPNLYQAWKLYEDHLDAFALGVIPQDLRHQDEYVQHP